MPLTAVDYSCPRFCCCNHEQSSDSLQILHSLFNSLSLSLLKMVFSSICSTSVWSSTRRTAIVPSIPNSRDGAKTVVSVPVRDKGSNFYRFSSIGYRPARCLQASVMDSGELEKNTTEELEVITSFWIWRGYKIRYQYAGMDGPALVLVHGFGANRSTSYISSFQFA